MFPVMVSIPVLVRAVAIGVGGVATSRVGVERGRTTRSWRWRGLGQGLEEVERDAVLVGDGGLVALKREGGGGAREKELATAGR
jgi:hypothetical protein